MTLMEMNNTLVGQVESLRQRGEAPTWVEDLRRRGAEHFERVGLPTLKDEEWQQTDVRPIAKAGFTLAEPEAESVSPTTIRPFLFPGLEAHLLVLVDGRLSSTLSRLGTLPEG